MAKYRKKPVVIEAWQIPPPCEDSNMDKHGAFAAQLTLAGCVRFKVVNRHGEIDIQTLEGIMRGRNGDWIIKGVKGEFYPCKPDVFAATYEPA